MLAACINSASPFVPCSNLYAAATPQGGTVPGDTLGALLDIALNPGNNVSGLYLLPPPQNPFGTNLTQPNDWTLTVKYTGGGLTVPGNLAIDSGGNVWVANSIKGGALSEFNTAGVSQQGTTGIVYSSTINAYGIAIAASGKIWVSSNYEFPLSSFASNGALLSLVGWGCFPASIAVDAVGNVYGGDETGSGFCRFIDSTSVPANIVFPYYSNAATQSLAVDGSGNLWAPTSSIGKVFEAPLANLATSIKTAAVWDDVYSEYAQFSAIDAEGGLWIPNLNGPKVVTNVNAVGVVQGTGYAISNYAYVIAIDGADTVWVATQSGSLSHLSHAGVAISPPTGYLRIGSGAMDGLGIDGSGNIWTSDFSNGSLVAWIGVAAPVVTPIAQNLILHSIGQRP